MFTALLTTLTLSGAVSTAVAARWVVVHRRRRARAAELEALSDDPPAGSAAHLSPSLAHLAAQARVVRLMLATPLQRCEPPVLRETPWGRRARCGQYDLALGDARRKLGDAGFARVDYIALVDGESLEPLRKPGGSMRLIVAAVIGTTRLIDNISVISDTVSKSGSPPR